MDIILVVLLVLLVGIASSILYLNLKSKLKDDNENKETEEIAKLKAEIVILKDTLCLIPAGEGKIGFMPFMPYTKAKDGLELDMKHIMFMVEPNDMLLEQHRAATSELAVPSKKIVT